jgi:hypothetical protein
MKRCGMKVALLGTTLEIPDRVPPNPETVPELEKLKSLLEEEFYNYFDHRIKIINWEYVFTRALAHRV